MRCRSALARGSAQRRARCQINAAQRGGVTRFMVEGVTPYASHLQRRQ
jgi:hypothetical protein